MAMLGMQADMRQQSPFPGCYTAWDLNLHANDTVWLPGGADRILQNKPYYNGTLPASDLNLVNNKDLLKQTILKHEAEFREQIHELHRLYRRQKELMDEMIQIELSKHHFNLNTVQANHILSSKLSSSVQIPQETSTSLNLVHCQPPLPEAKDTIFPSHSYDGNRGQADHVPAHIESSSKATVFMEYNCKRFGKKILDLELPAEEYIDDEEDGFLDVKMAPEVTNIPTTARKKIFEVRDRDDKELLIGGSGCNSVSPEGNCISSSISSKSKVLADLNLPVELDEDAIPELCDFEDPVIGQREISLQDLSGKSNSNFQVLYKEVIPDSQILRDPEAHADILQDKHKMQREYVLGNDKAGQRGYDLNSFCLDPDTEAISVKHSTDEQAQGSATPLGLDETKGKLCDDNLQSAARDISATSHKPVATSDMCSSYQIVPLTDTMNSELSSVSSRKRDFGRSPIVVQALPCFMGKSSKSFGGSSRPAGKELCLSKKHAMSDKILDLNLPSFSSNVTGSSDASHINGEQALEASTGCSPQIAETPILDGKSGERRDQSIPLECALEQANSISVCDNELEKMEASNSVGFKRKRNFHADNKPSIPNGQCSSVASPTRNHPNSCAKEDIKDKEKDRLPDIVLESEHVPDREKQLAITELVGESEPCEKYPGYRVLIDLNSCLSLDESLVMPSHSIEIDLEAPASPENKESSPPRGESDENQVETPLGSPPRGESDENQVETPLGSPPRGESDENQVEMPLGSSGQGDGDLQEEMVRIAAETIVSISSCEIQTCLESSSSEPLKTTWTNPLYWFSRLASAVVDDPGSEYGIKIGVKEHDDHEEYLSDGIDYFEAMTLNLTELKVEESWCKSNAEKEEEQSSNLLRNQPKRGRLRRGRQQRKDFQSEILPSLASLSRCEVTEDLQMIGGLMEAAGARLESGTSRNAGRNGYAKGRRRSNARTSNVMESKMNTLQTVNSEVGVQQRRLIEWGKITRRPRGPRCPSSNPRLILGQV